MTTINIKGIVHEPKFTFNSFKYMEEFDIDALQTLDKTPFKIIPVVEMLLLGALNSNPRTRVSLVEVDEFLDEFISGDGSLSELTEELINLLQESNFFKSLQKMPTKKAKK